MRKLLLIVIIVMIIACSACGAPAETEETESQPLEATEASSPEPTLEPTPEPTLSSAEVFAQEKGVTLPDIDGDIITDTKEIESIIAMQPYWSEVITEDAQLYGETNIMWYKQDGRYRTYSDFLDIGYGAGEWYFEDDMLITESVFRLGESLLTDLQDPELVGDEELPEEFTEFLDDNKSKETLVAAELEDGIHLYSCAEQGFIEYVPATQEEQLLVSTDPEEIANIRHFLCSASWELEGHYDDAGDYSNRKISRTYTFLADGQMVMREDGQNIPGYYTLNIGMDGFYDLYYLLEDGQAFYSPLWVDNSTHLSAIFLYPDCDLSSASDLYKAVYTKDVSDIVTEGEPIKSYQDAVVEQAGTDGGADFDLSKMNIDMQAIAIDSVWYSGYTIKDIYTSTGKEDIESVTVVFEDGSSTDIADLENATLIFNSGNEKLDKPLLWYKDKLSEVSVVAVNPIE